MYRSFCLNRNEVSMPLGQLLKFYLLLGLQLVGISFVLGLILPQGIHMSLLLSFISVFFLSFYFPATINAFFVGGLGLGLDLLLGSSPGILFIVLGVAYYSAWMYRMRLFRRQFLYQLGFFMICSALAVSCWWAVESFYSVQWLSFKTFLLHWGILIGLYAPMVLFLSFLRSEE